MWVRSDVTSGRNRRWEWRPYAGDAENGKTTSDASGRGARASDAGLIFADVEGPFQTIFPSIIVFPKAFCNSVKVLEGGVVYFGGMRS